MIYTLQFTLVCCVLFYCFVPSGGVMVGHYAQLVVSKDLGACFELVNWLPCSPCAVSKMVAGNEFSKIISLWACFLWPTFVLTSALGTLACDEQLLDHPGATRCLIVYIMNKVWKDRFVDQSLICFKCRWGVMRFHVTNTSCRVWCELRSCHSNLPGQETDIKDT